MPSSSGNHKSSVDLARVRAAIEPVLAVHGVVLDDVAWGTDRAGWTLRITIERPDSADAGGGVTLEDCAEVSRDVSTVLDGEGVMPDHPYNLEVSSPGLERPLRREADFERFTGKLARVKLTRPAPDGQRLLRGPLEPADPGFVAVRVDGKLITVPFADVAEANLVFELAREPKRGPGGRRGGRAAKKRVRHGA